MLSPAKSHCSLNGNSHLEPRVSGNRLYADEPAHFLDDAMNYIEAEAGSFAHALGGKKRLKDARLYFRWDARAIVGDLHEHVLIFAHRTHDQLALFFHGVDGVVDEVCPHLIQLAAVGHHLWQVGGKFARNHDAAL